MTLLKLVALAHGRHMCVADVAGKRGTGKERASEDGERGQRTGIIVTKQQRDEFYEERFVCFSEERERRRHGFGVEPVIPCECLCSKKVIVEPSGTHKQLSCP